MHQHGAADEAADVGVCASATAMKQAAIAGSVQFRNVYHFECRAPDGTLKWEEEGENLVVNEALDDILDVYWGNGTQTATWYVGLTDGTPTVAAGDTMASHAGWAEVTAYDEAVRQTLTLGSVSGQSVDNSASKATVTISANGTTIGGGFIGSDNTKGGTTGTLGGAVAFSGGDKSADDGDTLSVTLTLTASSS